MKKTISLFLLITSLVSSLVARSGETVHHDLKVAVNPATSTLEVLDSITLPQKACQPQCLFSLDKGLSLSFLPPSVKNYPTPVQQVNAWSVSPDASGRLTLKYAGTIRHGLENISDAVGKAQQVTRGTISEQGVYLDSASHWYPVFYNEQGELPVSFSLQVSLPEGWKAISQGQRSGNTWAESSPQQEIYLVAGKYRLYQRPLKSPGDKGEALVYLHEADDDLAERYLRVTDEYVNMYSKLLGDYPYTKFALAENFWESGYGMPSFTLLGPRVMRFPFILTSSYPHEILHNWWGNGVYVDYASGNWCEGLTSYQADHYFKEKAGKGADYRREALQKYADYVKKGDDFPLAEFHGRHGDISAAIGYSKGMMFFHMLKNRLGKSIFINGLRRLYSDFLFRQASFDDIRRSMEAASGEKLDAFFDQWIKRAGAPALALADARQASTDGGNVVNFSLKQTQPGDVYDLRIPVVIRLSGQSEPLRKVVRMSKKSQQFTFPVSAEAVSLAIDPQYDLFRQLDPSEIPVSLGQFFASKKALIVLPQQASPEMMAAWRKLARGWAASRPGDWKIVKEQNLENLPDDTAVLLLGWGNHFASMIGDQIAFDPDTLSIDGSNISKADHSIMLTTGRNGQVLAWLTADRADAIPGLARKLPHYGKYSYVAFSGAAPTIGLKGNWQITASPLMAEFHRPGPASSPQSTKR
ncbi:MAG: M1 family peptidase [Gammaproteobacteria bacterium]|nr:MAG: M1 family peptidase [Gammaproteobacteria bacterium]